MIKIERKRNNITEKWLIDNFKETKDESHSIPRQVLFSMYLKFCEQTKILAISRSYLGKTIKKLFPSVNKKRISEYGKAWYHYSNLDFKDSSQRHTNQLDWKESSIILSTSNSSDSNNFMNFDKSNEWESSNGLLNSSINIEANPDKSQLIYCNKESSICENQLNKNEDNFSDLYAADYSDSKGNENLEDQNNYCKDFLLTEKHLSSLFDKKDLWKVTTILILYRHQCQKMINQLNGNKIKQINIGIQQFSRHFPDILVGILDLPNTKLILLWSDCILFEKLDKILIQQVMQEYYDSTIIMLKYLRSTIEMWNTCLNFSNAQLYDMKYAVFETFDTIIICMSQIEEVKQKIKRISSLEKCYKQLSMRIKIFNDVTGIIVQSIRPFLPIQHVYSDRYYEAIDLLSMSINGLIVNIAKSSNTKAALFQSGWIHAIIQITNKCRIENEKDCEKKFYIFENFYVALCWFDQFSKIFINNLNVDGYLRNLAELQFKFYLGILNLEFIRDQFVITKLQVKYQIKHILNMSKIS